MSVDILGTSCDQCRSTVQYIFTSTETKRLVRTDSPGRPPWLSHSSWTKPYKKYLLLDVYLHSSDGSSKRWRSMKETTSSWRVPENPCWAGPSLQRYSMLHTSLSVCRFRRLTCMQRGCAYCLTAQYFYCMLNSSVSVPIRISHWTVWRFVINSCVSVPVRTNRAIRLLQA